VATVLHNFAMPFIRYNLHDLSAYALSHCDCGRTFPMLAGVEGRRDDYLGLPGRRECSPMPLLFELDGLVDWIREYRVVQTGLLEFELHVRPAGDFSGAARRRLAEIFERHAPGACLTLVESTAGIPRDRSGKRRCFVSKLSE
jgi:phenylacetate-CoA ligase